MEYRKLPRGEEKLSVIGLGSGSLGLASEVKLLLKKQLKEASISLIYVLEIIKYTSLLEKLLKELEKKFISNFTLAQFIKRMVNMVGVEI